jgi:hypothetical protein
MFPRQPVKHVLGQIRQASGGTRHFRRPVKDQVRLDTFSETLFGDTFRNKARHKGVSSRGLTTVRAPRSAGSGHGPEQPEQRELKPLSRFVDSRVCCYPAGPLGAADCPLPDRDDLDRTGAGERARYPRASIPDSWCRWGTAARLSGWSAPRTNDLDSLPGTPPAAERVQNVTVTRIFFHVSRPTTPVRSRPTMP